MTPLLTVIIPCFDCASQLEACVDSILAAAARCPDEVEEILLVADSNNALNEKADAGNAGGVGGLGDETTEVCASLAERHALVRVISHPITSASAKRNRAIEEATTSHLAFTDPDCIVGEDWLVTFARAARDGIRCATGPGPVPDDQFRTNYRAQDRDRVFRPGLLWRAMPYRAGASNSLMMERDLLTRIGGYPEDVGPGTTNGVAEDMEVLYLTLREGVPIHFLARAGIIHDHRVSFKGFLKKKENYARGSFYFTLRRYKKDPATWLGLALGFGYSMACLLAFGLTMRRVRVAQALAELRGRFDGIRLGLFG